MFDKVTFTRMYPIPFAEFGANEIVTYKGIDFTPERNSFNRQITRYIGYFRNIRITCFFDRVTVSNSLSRFLYGHNAKDLTHEHLLEAIETLCDFLDCGKRDLKINSLEFGLSFITSVPPIEIIRRLIAHKAAAVEDTIRQTKLIGRKFDHWNYNYKVYDKGLEQKIQRENLFYGNILRVEQQFTRKHIPKQILTSADLIEPENIQLIFDEFVKQWQRIEKAPFIDTSQLSYKEKDWFYSRSNPLYWIDQMQVNKNTAKIAKQRFKKKILEIGNFSIFDEVEKLFTEKYLALMANECVPDFPRIFVAGNRVHQNSN